MPLILSAVARLETRRVQARLAEVAGLSDFVETAVRPRDRDASLKMRLMVEELFVNTITHGHGGDSEAPVEVTVALGEHGVDLTYVDSAPAFDPFADVRLPDGGAPVEARMIGGVGVFLVTRLADRCAYERAGEHNRITIHVALAPGA